MADKKNEYYLLDGKTTPVKQTFASDEEAISAGKANPKCIRVQNVTSNKHIWDKSADKAAPAPEKK